MQGGEVCVW